MFCIFFFFARSVRSVSGGLFGSRAPGSYSTNGEALFNRLTGQPTEAASKPQKVMVKEHFLTRCVLQEAKPNAHALERFQPSVPLAAGNAPAQDRELSRSNSKAHGDASEPLRFSWNQFFSPRNQFLSPGMGEGQVVPWGSLRLRRYCFVFPS